MAENEIGWIGFQPEVVVSSGNPEAEKYGRMWTHPQYRIVAPGEDVAQIFLQQAKPKPGADVLDFGCGTGRGALALAVFGGVRVTMLDFVNNSLDEEVRQALTTQAHLLRFVKHDLEQPLTMKAEYGFCTDVMEHIPPEKVDRVLDNILMAARHVFFQIATQDDTCGTLIGESLHLTVKPYAWWLEQFTKRECLVHWSQEVDGACLFYVSAWSDGQTVVDMGVLNETDEQIRKNVAYNIAPSYLCGHCGEQFRDSFGCGIGGMAPVECPKCGEEEKISEGDRWTQVQPHPTNDMDVMILGGGPSLDAHLNEIRHLRTNGVKLVTMNGSYNWALEHGLTPSAQVIVDARPFNARFTKPVVEGCKYLIASQCDPAVFEGLPKDRTFIWHTTTEMIADVLKTQYELYWGVPGGSTVLLRAIPLLRMLGFKRFHLFGCDSCLSADNENAVWTLVRDGVPIIGETGGPMEFYKQDAIAVAKDDPTLTAKPLTGIHHAYAQTENDTEQVIPVMVTGGRVFQCHYWMAAQAQEFLSLIKHLGEEIELEIHGDGLLSHILKTGAEMDVDPR